MALSSFLNVNGYEWPCPKYGFSYTISTTVNNGRNTNNAVIGQRIGRDLIKLEQMEWVGLSPEKWKMILKSVEPFFVPVTFEDFRTGQPTTITMYPGDRKANPLLVNPKTHIVEKYDKCSFNLIDAGW